MKVRVRYFASLREALGPEEALELPEGATLGALRDALVIVLRLLRESAQRAVVTTHQIMNTKMRIVRALAGGMNGS